MIKRLAPILIALHTFSTSAHSECIEGNFEELGYHLLENGTCALLLLICINGKTQVAWVRGSWMQQQPGFCEEDDPDTGMELFGPVRQDSRTF